MWTARRMRSALLTTAALVIAVASATSLATSSSDVNWCSNTADVVLTSCGSLCGEDQACAQYPQKATTKCSEAARNKCVVYDDSCTYQCLNVYNDQVGKWTLFVKDPKTSDKFAASDNGFPVAPVSQFVDYTFASDAKTIQITGYDSIDVSKGSVQKVKLDTDIFTKSATVTQLALQNLDLSKIASNFLPTSLVTLLLDNCLLKDIPSDVGNMQNIKTFNVSNNDISDLPSADSKIVKMFQGLTTLNLRGNALTSFQWKLPSLTTLDLGNNKLTEFPTSIFNMTTLTTVYLDGNAIPSLSLTSAQLTYLKRMNAGSTLGIKAASGSCASGQTEEKLLDSVVCVTTSSPETTKAASSSGSSNTVIIIVAVVGGLLVVGAIGFVWHRRSKKQSEFYVSVMENGGGAYNNNTGGTTGGNNTNQSRTSMFGRNRAQSGGTRGSVQDNRNSRGNSMASRPSNMTRPSKTATNTGYAELSKPQEDFDRGSTATSGGATIFSGTRQRQSAKINQNVVRIASNDITYTRTIAKGAFGEVWLAHLGRDLVAVKKLLSTDPTSVGDFIAELNLLSSLSHPRILGLLGACWDDDLTDLQIVTEFMDSGDLLTVLRRSSPTELTWEKTKGAYCLQVCEAVYYLHSLQPALIHRDIKSRNILVDERKGAKLSDFGESRERTIQNTMTAGVGTARWVAPEIILGENYSELADIYSLGVLLTELDTHQIPFETLGLEEHMIVTQVAVGKLRPKVSDSCPEVIRRLAHECLQFDPQLRPTAARVLQTLMSSPLIGRPSTIKE